MSSKIMLLFEEHIKLTSSSIGFVHPCIQLQLGVKLLGCREYANQEALRAEGNDSVHPSICLIQL